MLTSATGEFVAYGVNSQAVEPLRRIEAAARDVFGSWLQSVLVTGPAVKDGLVPGFSVLTVHLFVDGEVLRPDGSLRPDLTLEFRGRIGGLSPQAYGFGEFRVLFQSDLHPSPDQVFAPGAFRLVYGEPPRIVCEITDEGLLRSAEYALDGLSEQRRRWTLAAVDRADDQLAPVLRGIDGVLETAAYSAGVLLTGTPFRVWASDLETLGPMLDTAGLESLTGFFDGVRQWPWRNGALDYQHALLRQGFDAMDDVHSWWTGSRHRLVLASV